MRNGATRSCSAVSPSALRPPPGTSWNEQNACGPPFPPPAAASGLGRRPAGSAGAADQGAGKRTAADPGTSGRTWNRLP